MGCVDSRTYPAGHSLFAGKQGLKTEADCNQFCKEGACCTGTTCAVTPQCQCQGAGKTFKGVGTTCTDAACGCCGGGEVIAGKTVTLEVTMKYRAVLGPSPTDSWKDLRGTFSGVVQSCSNSIPRTSSIELPDALPAGSVSGMLASVGVGTGVPSSRDGECTPATQFGAPMRCPAGASGADTCCLSVSTSLPIGFTVNLKNPNYSWTFINGQTNYSATYTVFEFYNGIDPGSSNYQSLSTLVGICANGESDAVPAAPEHLNPGFSFGYKLGYINRQIVVLNLSIT